MSAFIVISVKDSLNWIVDGIKDCRPHNPDVITHLSTGKIKKADENKYLYEYTTYSKHAGGGNTDEALAKTIESDFPRNLFKNQIAQFLHVCENEGEQINIFLLDNPITDEDFEQSTWLTDEIRAVYDSHFATNFQLVRVLFSYQVDNPTDVTRQVSKMVLKQLMDLNLNETDDFLTRILYVDNQNRNGAAICLDKEGHNIMLPRMLCDLMMLLSNKDDSYNTFAAINGDTRTFAVGYSECMYYHDDIFKYYSLAGKYDLTAYILDNKNDCVSLDYEKEPFGLADRQARLSERYEEIPFDVDIKSAPGSMDKEIDDILLSFKEDIIAIKEDALEKAVEEDRNATEKARDEKLAELDAEKDDNQENDDADGSSDLEERSDSTDLSKRKSCNFLTRLFQRNKSSEESVDVDMEDEVDPRVADIVITKEQDRVKKEYPDFISREVIYEQYNLEQDVGEFYKGVPFDANVNAYNRLIEFIQSPKFNCYLRNKSSAAPVVEQTAKKNHRKNNESETTLVDSTQTLKMSLKAKIDSIKSIEVLSGERKNYKRLKGKVSELKDELEQTKKEIEGFRLTTHCSSVDNLIDLDKLKKFYARGKDKRIESVIKRWKDRDDDTRIIGSLKEDLKETIKWDVFGFYYIKWDDPFEFIKEIDLPSVCKHLKAKSQPFVNTYTLGPNAENLTSYYFYTDNERWNDDIKNGRVDLKDTNKVSGTLSSHICSKICMFQFLQMSHELIEGLVDCYGE